MVTERKEADLHPKGSVGTMRGLDSRVCREGWSIGVCGLREQRGWALPHTLLSPLPLAKQEQKVIKGAPAMGGRIKPFNSESKIL